MSDIEKLYNDWLDDNPYFCDPTGDLHGTSFEAGYYAGMEPADAIMEELSSLKEQLRVRGERMELMWEALQAIVTHDAKYMYGTCLDCCSDSCSETQTCKDVPYSRSGILAKKALEGK